MNPDLFEPYDHLIDITVNGSRCRVPANNTVLRCLQYLFIESISRADLCWNGDCLNCSVLISLNGKEKKAYACIVRAEEGMEIESVSPELILETDEPV
ncbi:MAG TPA: 2Fe-2S iron-sulfur cluster-binding protein [Aridibacter sp.]|nr:2Fe-2S iron-sulfur cluster-binding protein [Aridibacter sp.]